MSVHLQREIEKLKKSILALCAIVEEQVQVAMRAMLDRDSTLALRVEQRDDDIDRREVEIEEECLKILALHQPVATDLRFIVAAMKINNDLERIGDLAVNIARKAVAAAAEPAVEVPFDIAGMGEKTEAMLRDSIDAMVNMDARLAVEVCRRDDEVDRLKHQIRAGAEERIGREPQKVGPLLRLLAVSRNLERIADCATNIAEDAIYISEGRIIRHRRGDG
ncbi:MAG: phosphate signaling complex protein PhoU [Planctomycetaceae bacterium]|nr:phosphate signaling complex protein PhoU [Planctomycetaceae bacterium]